MTYTTNYNLNIVEGTDIVNPLTQLNPNFTAIDGVMKNNADAAIDRAVCIKSGTQHSVTRSNTDASVFRFTATGDWNTGDTMLVDTVPVSVYTPNGTALLDGAFVINTEVLASIQGTRVVIYTANTQASSIDAIDVVYDNSVSGLTAITAQGAIDELRSSANSLYDNTTSGLSATNVQDAIDEIATNVPTPESVYVTADGVKNYKTLLQELYAIIDATKVKNDSYLELNSSIIPISMITASEYRFGSVNLTTGGANVNTTAVTVGATSFIKHFAVLSGGTVQFFDDGNSVLQNGREIRLYY